MEVNKGRQMGTKRDFAWGDGSTMQCVDGVLLSSLLETCMVF